MFLASPRLHRNSQNLLAPSNASRTMSKVHQSPTASRALPIGLDPALESEPKDLINVEFWNKAPSAGKERAVASLADLACSVDGAPHVARGLLRM